MINLIYTFIISQFIKLTLNRLMNTWKDVCQKDHWKFLFQSFFDITFFHGSLKMINLIYSFIIKAVNPIYQLIQTFCIYTWISHVYNYYLSNRSSFASMIRYISYQSSKSNLPAHTNILYIYIHESVTYITISSQFFILQLHLCSLFIP